MFADESNSDGKIHDDLYIVFTCPSGKRFAQGGRILACTTGPSHTRFYCPRTGRTSLPLGSQWKVERSHLIIKSVARSPLEPSPSAPFRVFRGTGKGRHLSLCSDTWRTAPHQNLSWLLQAAGPSSPDGSQEQHCQASRRSCESLRPLFGRRHPICRREPTPESLYANFAGFIGMYAQAPNNIYIEHGANL